MKNLDEELKSIKIQYIGDELRFQRLYYNCTHDKQIELGDCNAKGNYRVLGVEVAEYMYKNKIVRKENNNGISDKVLKTIEGNNYIIYDDTCKNNNSSVQDPSTHYFEIYCMFKIYGYLDDYDIFKLFEKYNVLGEIELLRKDNGLLPAKKEVLLKKIEKYKKSCNLEYKENDEKIPIDLLNPQIIINPYKMLEFLQEILKCKNILSNKKIFENMLSHSNHSPNMIYFKSFRNIMLEKFNCLSDFQRKCVSLDIGKPTNFIEDVLNSNEIYVTLETILKILEYLNLKDSDMYYLISNKARNEPILNKGYKRLKKFEL